MKTMKWLVKRELWEHKGMLVWTPVVVAGMIAALALLAIFLGKQVQFSGEAAAAQSLTVSIHGQARASLVDTLAQGYIVAAVPVYMVLGFLVFFYCLGALNDERRDRSILFWKSLPVSDRTTVLSKAFTALVVAPLIVVGIALALSLVLLLAVVIKLSLHGTVLFGDLLATPELYLAPLRVLGLLPVYVLWALPTVGWLLMISSMVRSKVFVWAVGLPLGAALLMVWGQKMLGFDLNVGWFISNITNRVLLGVVPGSWVWFDGRTLVLSEEHGLPTAASAFMYSWSTLGNVGLWIGVAAGIAMIAVAIRMRRRREEG
ncbi:ABC-2 type transport system permease protein [Duganella sp. 3397]|uniref:hypothetical protein n=1 Tax=Duganella sp. 3397 TaxID=2817732 RepID=UPI00286323B8|nr:hypothetical protein [Duganella sp. 3397]MDR7051089.1 ABC-2 type transport system permease protein [Duganella sp. 3397]